MADKLLKVITLLCSIIIAILMMNLILKQFFDYDSKEYLSSENYYANCYSSNKNNYFSIDLTTIDDGLFQEEFNLTNEKLSNLTKRTPYCILYNLTQREKGFNPERKRQIAIIGDSFTFGEGLKDEDTLRYLLNQKYEDINFQNHAFSGNNIYDVYSKVINLEDVESVIYFYNLNDVSLSDNFKSKQKYINDFQNIKFENINKSFIEKNLFFIDVIKSILTLKKESELTIDFYNDIYFDEDNSEQLSYTLGWIQDMDKRLSEKNIGFQVFIYPLMHKDKEGYLFENIHYLLSEEFENREINYLDLQKAFSNQNSLKKFHVNKIDFHPNGEANRLVVDYIKETSSIR